MIFFRKPYVAQIKRCSTKKTCVYSPGLRTNKLRSFGISCISLRILQWTAQICFLRSNPKYSLKFPLEEQIVKWFVQLIKYYQ